MQIGDEDGLGVFEIEGPPERDADGEQEEVIDVAADLAAQPDRERAIERPLVGRGRSIAR